MNSFSFGLLCLWVFQFIVPAHKFALGNEEVRMFNIGPSVSTSVTGQNELSGQYSWMNQHRLHNFFQIIESAKFSFSSSPKLKAFRWGTCDDGDTMFDLQDFSLSPDPLQFPGKVFVGFTGTFQDTVDAPLQVNLTLKKDLIGDLWITIPCVDGVGSCVYEDVCDKLQGITCPAAFVRNNIPCKCPFNQGQYELYNTGFEANFNSVPPGDYYIKADMFHKGLPVTCLEIYFSVTSNY